MPAENRYLRFKLPCQLFTTQVVNHKSHRLSEFDLRAVLISCCLYLLLSVLSVLSVLSASENLCCSLWLSLSGSL